MTTKPTPDATPASPSSRHTLGRRGLVVGAGVAGAAAVATHVVRQAGVEPVSTPTSATAKADEQGYRLTAHVQRYYETTKA